MTFAEVEMRATCKEDVQERDVRERDVDRMRRGEKCVERNQYETSLPLDR